MFYTKTSNSSLNIKRLDADFYRPDYLNLDGKLKTLPNITLGEIGQFFSGPFGSKLPSNLYLDQGIPLFRVSNVGQFEVLLDGMAYLDESVHQELITSEVIPGDLLVVKASVGEKICKVPEWLPKANITQHIIGIRPNGVCDLDYVSAFLFSSYGVGQLQRYSLGSIIQYLGITDAKSVILYNPKSLVQKYIGDKIRQAEALKNFSNNVFLKIRQYFDAKLPIFKSEKKCYKLNSNDLEDRLDSQYYQDRYLVLKSFFSDNAPKSKILGEFVLEALSGPAIPSSAFNTENRGVSVLQTKDIRENYIDYDKCVKIDEKLAENFLRFKVGLNTLVMGMSGTVGRTALITSEIDSYILNQRVAGLKLKDNRFSGYLCAFLNHTFGAMQLERQTVGGVQANISLYDILNINIFIDATEAEAINQSFLEASLASELSKKLIKSSSIVIEGLVDGLITETALLQAQNALEQGDTSLDRAILSQMTEDGYAVAGSKPLFSDLDEFYDLLEQAKALE